MIASSTPSFLERLAAYHFCTLTLSDLSPSRHQVFPHNICGTILSVNEPLNNNFESRVLKQKNVKDDIQNLNCFKLQMRNIIGCMYSSCNKWQRNLKIVPNLWLYENSRAWVKNCTKQNYLNTRK